jgi:hypothetical protein
VSQPARPAPPTALRRARPAACRDGRSMLDPGPAATAAAAAAASRSGSPGLPARPPQRGADETPANEPAPGGDERQPDPHLDRRHCRRHGCRRGGEPRRPAACWQLGAGAACCPASAAQLRCPPGWAAPSRQPPASSLLPPQDLSRRLTTAAKDAHGKSVEVRPGGLVGAGPARQPVTRLRAAPCALQVGCAAAAVAAAAHASRPPAEPLPPATLRSQGMKERLKEMSQKLGLPGLPNMPGM